MTVVLIFQLIQYVDKDNTADMDDYQQPNSTWFDFYDLSAAAWKDLTFDNVSQTVTFTAVNDSQNILPFLANGSLSFKANTAVFLCIDITRISGCTATVIVAPGCIAVLRSTCS